jgi:hypothetical protein
MNYKIMKMTDDDCKAETCSLVVLINICIYSFSRLYFIILIVSICTTGWESLNKTCKAQ